jgi:hypothetical protein
MLLGLLGLLGLAVEVGVACGSSSDSTLPPPPGTSSATSSTSTSSSSGSGGGGGGGSDAGSDAGGTCVPDAGETDTNCGGPNCPPCFIGKDCKTATDCVGGNCASGVCACPQGMINVPIPGGGSYCIDAVEVTYTQYQAFYTANPPTSTQSSFCSWNTNYTPTMNWPAPQASAAAPVSYVNWCQAEDYCQWAGKRLCGTIGGGSAQIANAAVATSDQWYNACSAGGTNLYPYGATYSAQICNGAGTGDGGLGQPWQEQANMTCIGGETGLFDMSGNVAEWEDACMAMTGMTDSCLTRGGSFESSPTQLLCSTTSPVARSYAGPDVGFRCCL